MEGFTFHSFMFRNFTLQILMNLLSFRQFCQATKKILLDAIYFLLNLEILINVGKEKFKNRKKQIHFFNVLI